MNTSSQTLRTQSSPILLLAQLLAVAGLNALVDAGVAFHVEPDGHISAPFSDEHIEWDLKASRWVLTHDDEDEDVPPVGRDLRPGAEAARRTIRDREPIHALAEAYPGELFMFRGLVGVLRVVAEQGDMAEVRRLLAEHASDERDAYAGDAS